MKKYDPSVRLCKRFTLLFILFLLTGVISCRDGLKQVIFPKSESPTSSTTDYLLQRMDDKDKVHPAEILTWLKGNIPAENIPALQLNKAQQNVVKGIHVVKIPVTLDGAMFFTKEKGVLQVYSYKWNDKDPGKKLFTGSILAYSYNSRVLKELKYDQSKVVAVGDFPVPALAAYSIDNKLKVNEASFWDFLKKLWCMMTNGEWVKPDDSSSAAPSNDIGRDEGCSYSGSSSSDSGADAAAYNGPFGPGLGTTFGSPSISTTDLGANGSAGAGLGDGYVWVSAYKSGNSGCLPGAGEGLNNDFPADGCVYGTYVYYQIQYDSNDPIYDPELPELLDPTGLDNYPKLKNLVTGMPGFLQQYPNIVNALSYYTGFSTTKILRLMKPGAGPKVQVIPNLVSANNQPVLGHYDEATKTLQLNQSLALGLESAQLSKTIQATALLIALTALHEFVHYGRDANHLSNLFVDPVTGNSSEAGWTFEANIAPTSTTGGITKYNALDWINFYPYNFSL
jgi:hypothetical protein